MSSTSASRQEAGDLQEVRSTVQYVYSVFDHCPKRRKTIALHCIDNERAVECTITEKEAIGPRKGEKKQAILTVWVVRAAKYEERDARLLSFFFSLF